VTGVPTTLTSYVRDNDIALFVQDDYKLKPNLTVNLGLRWEYFGPFHEKFNNLGRAVLGPSPDELADISVKLGGNLYKADYHNFGPQIGFAWSPTVRPAAYLGGAGTDYSNSTFKKPLGNFPNGPTAYFTPPTLSITGIPPAPGVARNSFRGPRYSSVDFTIAKAFGLPSATRRIFRQHSPRCLLIRRVCARMCGQVPHATLSTGQKNC
jgi:hypothetical protein